MPQYDAGRKVEPPVCEPNAAGIIRAATAAAEPLLEPPGVCSVFQGLRVGRISGGKLGGDGLAEDDCASLLQSHGDGGIVASAQSWHRHASRRWCAGRAV